MESHKICYFCDKDGDYQSPVSIHNYGILELTTPRAEIRYYCSIDPPSSVVIIQSLEAKSSRGPNCAAGQRHCRGNGLIIFLTLCTMLEYVSLLPSKLTISLRISPLMG